MTCKMVVYESEGAKDRDPADTARFDESVKALEAAGIGLCRVMCSSVDDVEDAEAKAALGDKGIDALPVSVYDGVVISSGAYPTDQELADFLDAPDGTLSVNKDNGPAMPNDLPPAGCACNNNAPDKC